MMSEPNRPVRPEVSLIDTDVELPPLGAQVFALGRGGKLCEIIWTRESHKFFLAWMPYPKIPKSVKEKLFNSYLYGETK